MLAAESIISLGALLVATVRGGAVVCAAPSGRDHVVARVAAAGAGWCGACAVQVAKARGSGDGARGVSGGD